MIASSPHRADRCGRDLRVLLIAEAANPERASVPLEGWSHSRAISEQTNAHVVTQVRNEAAFLRAGVPREAFTALDSEAVAARVYRVGNWLGSRNGKGWTTLTALNSLAYYYFEHVLWQRFKHRIGAGEFDLVHRLTPLSPTIPSLLAGRCQRAGVPFVLGPLNGGVPWPRGFDRTRRQEREWLSYLRSAYRLLPGYHRTRRHAGAIIIGSLDTWTQMPAQYRHKCVYIPENGLDEARFQPVHRRRPRRPLRLIFLGRLVPYKGADILLEAAAPMLKAGLLQLTIVGDGPEMSRLQSISRQGAMTRHVHFTGWVEHTSLHSYLADADVFAFPSIREFGGAVVLEAMAAGVVPMVVDYGGPAELVTDATGYRIPMGSRDELIERFRRQFSRLLKAPEELVGKASAARRRARMQFSWKQKAQQCVEVYRWMLGQREKPDFGMPLPDLLPASSVQDHAAQEPVPS